MQQKSSHIHDLNLIKLVRRPKNTDKFNNSNFFERFQVSGDEVSPFLLTYKFVIAITMPVVVQVIFIYKNQHRSDHHGEVVFAVDTNYND